MRIAWAVVVLVVSVPCWLGQVLSWWAPDVAARWGLQEAESSVDPAFWADAHAEAVWDSLTLWTMVVAGGLMLVGHDSWPAWGLVGVGMYLYFAGRGIAVRASLRRGGFRVGTAAAVRTGVAALAVWGAVAAVTLVAAAMTLDI